MRNTTRREFCAAAAALIGAPSAALAQPTELAFAAFRNGRRIGEHRLSFQDSGGELAVRIRAEMAVKLGPVTVYRYVHDVTEQWRGGAFVGLVSRTSSNGVRESVSAQRSAKGLSIETAGKTLVAPAATLPFTHWNPLIAKAPLFNPQTGKLLKLAARDLGAARTVDFKGNPIQARRVAFRGDAEIDDWYDAAGTWAALRGRLDDGSLMEYRRL